MKPLYMLIKPASGKCNMRCRYCFYEDEAKHRQFEDYGWMSGDTLETVVRKSLAQAQGSCTFGFQGGEPTLRGLPFFQKAVALQRQYQRADVTVMNAIQTNGLLIDDAWAEFFREHRFLVGLSVDGTSKIHNQNRVDAEGNGTLRRAMEAARRLKAHKVDFNLLTVVTNDSVQRVDRIFDFFMRQGLVWQQYIPCLDSLNGTENWLEPKEYGQFLIGLFDLWAREVLAGRFLYIRQFENYLGMLLGKPPESCDMRGQCSRQYVVEADGSVFPCDFYCMDSYRLGNIQTDSFETLDSRREEIGFVQASLEIDAQCRACEYYSLCRGGCRRYRDVHGAVLHNRFCEAYRAFFKHAWPVLHTIARRVADRSGPA